MFIYIGIHANTHIYIHLKMYYDRGTPYLVPGRILTAIFPTFLPMVISYIGYLGYEIIF